MEPQGSATSISVRELSRELGIEVKDIVRALAKEGEEMMIPRDFADKVRGHFRPAPRWNLFTTGDFVRHKETPRLLFQVGFVWIGVPEKKADYLYGCRLAPGYGGDRRRIYKYHDRDLVAEAD